MNQLKELLIKYKVLVSNFSYLAVLQMITLLVPIVTLPHLFGVLGDTTWGVVVYAQAVVLYLGILVSFGFNISATKDISVHRDNPSKISEIVSSVFILKGLLFIVSLFIITILIYTIPFFSDYKLLYFLSMWFCLYEFIFPIWYFQGLEKMKYITLINLGSRLIFLVLIFVLIRQQSDYILVPVINGIGALFSGLISMMIIFKKDKVKFFIPSVSTLKFYFKESSPIFLSNLSQLYVKMNKIIIGPFIGVEAVAYYDVAEKITSLMKVPIGLISQTVFPKIVKEKSLSFIQKIFKLNLAIQAVLLLIVIPTAPYIVKFISGKDIPMAATALVILSFTVIPVVINNTYAVQTLLAFDLKTYFTRAIVGSGIVYGIFILIMYLFDIWYLYGICVAVLVSELATSVLSYYYVKKNVYSQIKPIS
ncbi:MAG: oligosaccharide flippase family protein [Winogradskyella sp.]|uniref:oligosaccharide flippase family protein n=1 Tax=Winogradskyella sp. TaxID=1883156 RepID=UPI00385BBE69